MIHGIELVNEPATITLTTLKETKEPKYMYIPSRHQIYTHVRTLFCYPRKSRFLLVSLTVSTIQVQYIIIVCEFT